jgi:hypothetical protein
VCRLEDLDGQEDRVLLLLSDVTEEGATALVLSGRVACKEPGTVLRLKGLVRFLLPL